MRLKLDIRELRTFRTKHTINDLKTKKTITQSLCDLPFNEANRGNCFFFFLGGGGAKFAPVIATLPILGLKFIKLFCAFL